MNNSGSEIPDAAEEKTWAWRFSAWRGVKEPSGSVDEAVAPCVIPEPTRMRLRLAERALGFGARLPTARSARRSPLSAGAVGGGEASGIRGIGRDPGCAAWPAMPPLVFQLAVCHRYRRNFAAFHDLVPVEPIAPRVGYGAHGGEISVDGRDRIGLISESQELRM